jgi:hypothetical protein
LYRTRKHEGAVAACCGKAGRIEVEYYLQLKKLVAMEEAPESVRRKARSIIKLLDELAVA